MNIYITYQEQSVINKKFNTGTAVVVAENEKQALKLINRIRRNFPFVRAEKLGIYSGERLDAIVVIDDSCI